MELLISVLLSVFSTWISAVTCVIQPMPMPDKLASCYKERTMNITITEFPSQDINSFCINKYLWETAEIRYHYNVSNDTMAYISSLYRKVVGEHLNHRHKRQLNMDLSVRRRKEVRALSAEEWQEFVSRMNWLKLQTDVSPNRYDAIASFHQGITSHSAHSGPNFYGWHRLYLLIMESALGVSIPYWDCTMDFRMRDPTRSIVWSPYYFGNLNGLVTTGPFRYWQTLGIPLTRNGASDGSLLTKRVIDRVMSRRHAYEITEGTSSPLYSLESVHNAPHAWIDGALGRSETSTADPIFFVYHAYIDYLWYLFRQQQKENGIDPATDYPSTSSRFHEPFRQVEGFSSLTNFDCYSEFFENIVQYDDSPTCPDCGGSSLINCENGECVSVENPLLSTSLQSRQSLYNPIEPSLAQVADSNSATGRGVILRDQRTLAASRGFSISASPISRNIMQLFPGTFFIGLRRKRSLGKISRSLEKLLADRNVIFHDDYENTFVIDGKKDIDAWSFVPIKVIYERPSIAETKEMQLKLLNKLLRNQNVRLAKHEKCVISGNKTSKVFVQSDGIDYSGRYKDYVTVDETVPLSTELAYVGIKNPKRGTTQAYLTAYDSCGRACKPLCQVRNSKPLKYTPCSGVISISPEFPKMFSTSLLDAVDDILSMHERGYKKSVSKIDSPVVFVCDYTIKWPWVLN